MPKGSATHDPPRVSPLPTPLTGLALALVLATLLLRTLTTGSGLELESPGAQLLFDGLALAAAASLATARALAGRPVLGVGAPLLAAFGVWVAVQVASALGAPHADLAWRSVLTPTALVLLGLTAGDLARDPRLARLLGAALLACVATGAGLGLWWYFVEQPELRRQFEAGELTGELGLYDASFQQGLRERIHDRAAVGPYVIGNLLACAAATTLPLALALTWLRRRTPRLVGWPLAVSGLLLGGLLLSGSKGGLVASAAAGAAFVIVHPRLAARRRRLALAGLGLAALALVAGLGLYLRDPEARGLGMSVQVRLEYWSAGLGMWGDAPWLGQGPNHYREWVSAYKSARAEEALHAHSVVIQALAETGLLGLAALAALVLIWGRLAWRQLAPAVAEGSVAGDPTGSGHAPQATADGPPDPAGLPRAQAGWCAVSGYALGVLLLIGFGDYLDPVQDALPLAGALVGVFGLTAALDHAWPRGGAPLCTPAALAGGVAFLAAAQLDFAFQHAGTLAVAACLVGLAPHLDRPAAAPRQPAWLAGGLAAALGGVALVLVLGVVPAALQADALRTEGIALKIEAHTAAQEGDAERVGQALRGAAAAFEGSLEAYPSHAATWRELAATQEGLGDPGAAIVSLRTSLAHNPRAHVTWLELGVALARLGRWDEAITALDEAVARYPHHPGLLLEAGAVRIDAGLIAPAGPTRDVFVSQGLELLDRAERASDTTRLVLRKLTPAQAERIAALRQRAGA